MKTGASLKNRQGGAVAVMVGISMVVLIGFLAMVIDLGRLYVARAGLQNAADAAALSGAKELDGTSDGVTLARNEAIEVAGLNTFFASSGQTPVDLPDLSISFGASSTGPWVTVSDALSSPVGKLFIKVDTASGNLTTWFAPIWNIFTTSTYGLAVAGRSKVQITPIAMCSIDVRQCPCLPGETNCDQGGLQCGYEPGKSYHLAGAGGVNPIGAGTPVWVDAVATPNNPTCNGDAPHTVPYICKGEANVSATPGDTIYTNTGGSYGPQLAALDSRFGDYVNGVGECDPVTAPPDRNIQEFLPPPASCTPPVCSPYTTASTCNGAPVPCKWNAGNCVPKNPPPANCSDYVNWMTPAPIAQTSLCTPTGTDQYGAAIYDCPWSPNGVYWSAVSGVAVSGVAPNTFYPASGTPYTQTSGGYFKSGGSGQLAGRRLLNLLIVQCEAAGGQCRPARNRMVGQFLLQTRSSLPGKNDIDLEFVRTVSQDELRAEIRLYR